MLMNEATGKKNISTKLTGSVMVRGSLLALAVSLGSAAHAQDQGSAAHAQDQGSAAQAQDQGEGGDGAVEQARSGGLGEIVVTARRREENLQDTPISVTAFSSEALELRQADTVGDIGRFAPNVSLEPVANISGSSASITTFIRGVGQTDFNITVDPGVGLYYDGVYVARTAGALLDLGDVQSIQILRGPQGTLFGKNTIGGAIIVNSIPPSNDFDLEGEIATGSFNRLDARGMINVPVSDRVAVRAVVGLRTRDGYQERLSDGGRQGNVDTLGGRIAIRAELTDDFKATLSFDANRRREQSAANTLLQVSEGFDVIGVAGGFPVTNGGFQSFFWNKVLQAPNCGPVGTPAPATVNCYGPHWFTNNIDKTWGTNRNLSNFDLWGTNLTLDWEIGSVDFKSITAYRETKAQFSFDFDGSPIPLGESFNNIDQKQFSQEFQLTGTLFDGVVDFTGGLYYLKEKATDSNLLTFAFADFVSGGDVDNDSYAAYLQATINVTDRFSITPGIRYTDETKRFDPSRQRITDDRTGGALLLLSRCFVRQTPIIPPDPALCPTPDTTLNPQGDNILSAVEVQTKASEWTPALSLDYKVTDQTLIYASYSKGFKSGGFTQRIFPPEPAATPFAPEFVESYEVGVKSELFDRRLRLNIAAFQADYTDIQIVVNEGIAPKVRNAGRARIRGIEVETQAKLADFLTIQGGFGYLDAYYREVSPTAAPVNVNSRFPQVPKWTASGSFDAELYKGDAGTLSLHGDWSYKGGHFKDAINTPALYQEGYSVFGANLSYELPGDNWDVRVGVTNLTDKRYLLGGYSDLQQTGATTGGYSRPREWFLKLRYRY